MADNNLPNHVVYSQGVIDFVTVTAETCIFLENAENEDAKNFIDTAVKLLPLLYLKAALLKAPEPVYDMELERFVTEDDYAYVKEIVENLLGPDDGYLEVFHPDMALSDTPIAAFISEDIADIYQEIKDFAANYQTLDVDTMNDSLLHCLETFSEHWGQKLLNALRALHSLRHAEGFNANEEEELDLIAGKAKLKKTAFLDFLSDDEEDFSKLL